MVVRLKKKQRRKKHAFFSLSNLLRNFHNTSQKESKRSERERDCESKMDALKAEGAAALASNDVPLALEKYQCALAFANTNAEKGAIESNLSFVELKLSNFTMAKLRAKNAIHLRPEWEKGYFRLAEVLFEEKFFVEAKVQYEIARTKTNEKTTLTRLLERIHLVDEALSDNGFYFRQLMPGKDICIKSSGKMSKMVEMQVFQAAKQMQNFIYLVGDAKTRECVVIDACWDVEGIIEFVKDEKMKLIGAVATHYHFDHVGGTPPSPWNALGIKVPGLATILEFEKEDANFLAHVPVHDAGRILSDNPTIKDTKVHMYDDDSTQVIGRKKMRWIHTPGHSPGSSVLVFSGDVETGTGKGQGIVLSGDTIFPGSCGRLDMPDGSVEKMYESMKKCRQLIDKNCVVYPGHAYNGNFSTIGRECSSGMLREMSKEQWMAMHSR